MKETIVLKQENLIRLAGITKVPTFDRAEVKAGIVHIGVGGFHRAHQAYYLHQLLQLGKASDWGICGIGLRKADMKLHDILQKQDHLYTLMVKNPDGRIEPEVIGSIMDFKIGIGNPESVIARMAHPDTKIVSLTITEGGYNFNPNTGEFDFYNPDIQHELDHPEDPRTVYGFLTAALKRRYREGLPAFTVLSCDNIEHNGDMARKMLLAFAEAREPDLAAWMAREVGFPNSMVDRITPVTTLADIETLARDHGVQDAGPVTCEPFIQWVIEDKFPNGRPALEEVGVQFVPDVGPYEKMKLRLLNAGHSVLGLLGAIHGHPTINACMEDETFVAYLRTFLDKEATPILGSVEGIDLEDYKTSLLARFANPNIRDSVSRICSQSSAKLPKFLIATIAENLDREGSIQYATLVIAAWCYYSDRGIDKNGNAIEIIDHMGDELQQAAQRTRADSLSFVRQESIFGDLVQNERFTNTYASILEKIHRNPDIKKHMEEML